MLARDVMCFSHLRWNFVFQRPNHLMSRFARQGRVLFVEEAMHEGEEFGLECVEVMPNLCRVIPRLPAGVTQDEATAEIRARLAELCREQGLEAPVLWFYTPMMLTLSRGLPHSAIVYDCMDELSNFKDPPPGLRERERELMARADVVFTGGMALYEAKRAHHPNVHGVPSSVDVELFQRARAPQPDPVDQAAIARPRVGYCGVIDERLDLELLAELARRRPALQIVMIGPVAKIEAESLPRLPSIHYLGAKPYRELPAYMAGWDAAIMPFALNEATRFISPTKTPEYLAAGKAVVATAITDVVEPYERLGLVRIGRDAEGFAAQVDAALADDGRRDHARDQFLAGNSWDATWERMRRLLGDAMPREDLGAA